MEPFNIIEWSNRIVKDYFYARGLQLLLIEKKYSFFKINILNKFEYGFYKRYLNAINIDVAALINKPDIWLIENTCKESNTNVDKIYTNYLLAYKILFSLHIVTQHTKTISNECKDVLHKQINTLLKYNVFSKNKSILTYLLSLSNIYYLNLFDILIKTKDEYYFDYIFSKYKNINIKKYITYTWTYFNNFPDNIELRTYCYKALTNKNNWGSSKIDDYEIVNYLYNSHRNLFWDLLYEFLDTREENHFSYLIKTSFHFHSNLWSYFTNSLEDTNKLLLEKVCKKIRIYLEEINTDVSVKDFLEKLLLFCPSSIFYPYFFTPWFNSVKETDDIITLKKYLQLINLCGYYNHKVFEIEEENLLLFFEKYILTYTIIVLNYNWILNSNIWSKFTVECFNSNEPEKIIYGLSHLKYISKDYLENIDRPKLQRLYSNTSNENIHEWVIEVCLRFDSDEDNLIIDYLLQYIYSENFLLYRCIGYFLSKNIKSYYFYNKLEFIQDKIIDNWQKGLNEGLLDNIDYKFLSRYIGLCGTEYVLPKLAELLVSLNNKNINDVILIKSIHDIELRKRKYFYYVSKNELDFKMYSEKVDVIIKIIKEKYPTSNDAG